MFTKAFVTTSNSDVKPFNEIAQHDGRDFWQVRSCRIALALQHTLGR